jgi:hypothetical protein
MYIFFLPYYRNCTWYEQEANAYTILARNIPGSSSVFASCPVNNEIIIVFISVNTTNYLFNI